MKVLKKILVFVSLLISIAVQCQNASTSIDSALIACYPFSGNANDFSGNGLNGTVNGASLVSDRFGNPFSAYYFSGNTATSNIVLPSFSSQLNGDGVSISFWTSKTSYDTRAAFLMVPDNASNRLCVCVYYGSSSSNAAVFWDYGNISSNGRLTFVNCPLPPANVWDHWVFVSSQSGNYMKAYKNGTLIYTKTSSSTFTISPVRDLAIGGGTGVGSGYLWYEGKIDDIRIYKRILLPSEVSYIYNNNLSCTACGTVAIPSNPGSPSTMCSESPSTLIALGSPSVNWYTSLTPSLSVGSGTSFSSPSFSVPGTYTYYARSFGICSMSGAQVYTFTVVPTPTLQVATSHTLVCLGETASLTAGGATSYTWLPGNIQSNSLAISPSSTSVYTITGANSSCTNLATISIPVANVPTISTYATNSVICSGQSALLLAIGANSYTWLPGNVNTLTMAISPLSTTVYTVTGAANGCTDTATITMSVTPLPSITIVSTNSVICSGLSAIITASGASTYTWLPGNIQSSSLSVSPLSTTVYTVTGEANGCLDTAMTTMSVASLPTIAIASSNSVICFGKSAIITASGALTYTWYPGNIQSSSLSISPTGNTIYSVTGQAGLCSNTATITVPVVSLPTISIVASSTAVCSGAPVSFTASGANTYSWSTGSNFPVYSITPAASSGYTVTGSNINNCVSSAVVNIIVNPLPVIKVASNSSVICNGEVTTLTASGAGTYTWSNGMTLPSFTILPSGTTSFTVTGKDSVTGCENSGFYTQFVDECSGMPGVDQEAGYYYLFPNPNNGRFFLTVPVPTEVIIYNSLGQQVYKNLHNGTSDISIESASNGIYFIVLTNPRQTLNYRMLKN
jgi:hypothetical protein